MRELRFFGTLKFGDDALRKGFPQFHAPLVERIDAPDCALSEDRVFVQRHQFPQVFRRELIGQDRVRRTIALKYPMRDEPLWCSFRLDLFRSLAERQRLGLRANIGDQHVMVMAKWIERFRERDKVARYEPGPLMN